MGNFPNIQLINFQNLKNSEILGITQMPGYLGNFQNIGECGKFPRMPGNLGNFPNAWEFGKFLKYLEIWKIPQISE